MKISDLHEMAHGRPVIYLLDAANRFEESLLRERLQAERSLQEANAQPFAVPILRAGQSGRLQQALSGPGDTLVAPLRVVWQPAGAIHQAPRIRDLLLGDRHRPGKIRAALIMRRHPERVTCVVGQPATIERLRALFEQTGYGGTHDEPDGFANFVERQASLVLDIAERSLQGGRYKVPKFVAENLQGTSRFNAAIDALSAETETPRNQLVDEARTYMREMIARPATFWIDVMSAMNRFICSRGYEAGIVCDGKSIEWARRIVRDNPSVLLWTHKSYVDGFAITALCFDNDFPAPHILGGVNMAFTGLGFLGRRTPAIFIRRTFKDNPLYKLVLRHYLGYLMEKRFPLSWAFEGTRSRVGKLMPPRYGLLKYTLDAARETDARNIHLVPVAISYDLITDVADYAAEQTGMRKKPETLGWFLGYIRRLRRPMGRVYVNFGEPVVLEKAPPEDDEIALSRIALKVAVNANAVTPITLPSLGCMVLLGATPQALTTRELRGEVSALIEWAQRRKLRLTSDFDLENVDHRHAISRIMVDSGLVTHYAEGPQSVYGIAAEKQLQASYYRNTVIHYFVNKAITELALARAAEVQAGPAGEVFWKEVERIRNLLKFEFIYAPLPKFREEIRFELADVQPEWQSVLSNGGPAANQMLSAMQPYVAHATLIHFVEAYSVVADLLAGRAPDRGFDEKDCITRAIRYARQLILQRRILSQASVSELLFRNAYRLLENKGLTAPGDDSMAARRDSMALELRDLRLRLRRIRAMALTARAQIPRSAEYDTARIAGASG